MTVSDMTMNHNFNYSTENDEILYLDESIKNIKQYDYKYILNERLCLNDLYSSRDIIELLFVEIFY